VTVEGPTTLDVVSATRRRVGEVQVPSALVAAPVREHVLYEVVKSQLAGRRAGTHQAKTRALVSGGGKKPWRQKGTGRARAGSTRSPLWRGGAVIFGPQPRDYGFQLPKSARRAALCAAISARHAEGKLVVLDGITLPEPKTKRMVEFVRGLGLEGSVLVVIGAPDEAVERAARNLPDVKVLRQGGVNVRDVLGHQHLVMTRDALEAVAARVQGAAA